MASRYWVGAPGAVWALTSPTTNWSATPGGPAGASVPTTADDVFFPAGGTATINTTPGFANGRNWTFSGTTTLSSPGAITMYVQGDWNDNSNNVQINLASTSFVRWLSPGSNSISWSTTSRCANSMIFQAGTWTFNTDFTNPTAPTQITGATVVANNKTISTRDLQHSTGAATINFGTGQWILNPTAGGQTPILMSATAPASFPNNGTNSGFVVAGVASPLSTTVNILSPGISSNPPSIFLGAGGSNLSFANNSIVKDITYLSNCGFQQIAGNINVYGNVLVQGGTFLCNPATGNYSFQFLGSAEQYIDTPTAISIGGIWVNKPAGNVTMNTAITCQSFGNLALGNLIQNNNSLTVTWWQSNAAGTRRHDMGTASLTLTYANTSPTVQTVNVLAPGLTVAGTKNLTHSIAAASGSIHNFTLGQFNSPGCYNLTASYPTGFGNTNFNTGSDVGDLTMTAGNNIVVAPTVYANVWGNLTFSGGGNFFSNASTTRFFGTPSSTSTISLAPGKSMFGSGGGNITIDSLGNSKTWSLSNNWTITGGQVNFNSGTLTFNNNILDIEQLYLTGANNKVFNFGSGYIVLTPRVGQAFTGGSYLFIAAAPSSSNISYTDSGSVTYHIYSNAGSSPVGTTRSWDTTGLGPANAFSVYFGSTPAPVIQPTTYAITGGSWFKNLNITAGATNAPAPLSIQNITTTGNLTVTGDLTWAPRTPWPASPTNGVVFAAPTGNQSVNITPGLYLNFPLRKVGAGNVRLSPFSTGGNTGDATVGSYSSFTLDEGGLDLNNLTLTVSKFISNTSNSRNIQYQTPGTSKIVVGYNYASPVSDTIVNIQNSANLTVVGNGAIYLQGPSSGIYNLNLGPAIENATSNFVANYSTGTINFTNNLGYMKDLTVTTVSSLGNANVTLYGNYTYTAGTIATGTGDNWTFAKGSGTQTWNDTNTRSFNVVKEGAGTLQLASNLTLATGFGIVANTGTFDANNKFIAVDSVTSNTSNTRALTLGSGNWTVAANGWDAGAGPGLTITASTSNIIMASSSDKSFIGGSKTYYKLINGGTGNLTIEGNNSFNDLLNNAVAVLFNFKSGDTQTFTNFSANGASGAALTIKSTTPGQQHFLSKSSGTVSVYYATITDSAAIGGATWEALTVNNNTDGGNNSGWNFGGGPPPAPATTAFFIFF